MNKLLCLLIIVFFLGLDSCKKDDPDPVNCGTAWSSQLINEIAALTNAALAYSASPTTTSCNTYKAAMQTYIDKLEPFGNCSIWSAQEKSEFQAELAEAKADLPNLCD